LSFKGDCFYFLFFWSSRCGFQVNPFFRVGFVLVLVSANFYWTCFFCLCLGFLFFISSFTVVMFFIYVGFFHVRVLFSYVYALELSCALG